MLAAVAACESEIVLQHAGHLVDILTHAVDLGTVADQRQFKLEAGQDGTQIVRHAGQHRGALLDGALDARFHLQKRLRGAAHFTRAAGTEVRRLTALAEAFGGIGQPQDRPDLVAQEQHRDDQQDRRGTDHPEQENLGIRGVSRAALREDAHHGVIELNPDLHQIGAANGIDPERLCDLSAELHGERQPRRRSRVEVPLRGDLRRDGRNAEPEAHRHQLPRGEQDEGAECAGRFHRRSVLQSPADDDRIFR